MPIYEYECSKCGHRFELLQKFSDPSVKSCPECRARKVHRLTSAPAIQFKGAGWYVSDYSDKGKATREEGKAEAKSAEAASEKSAEAAREKTKPTTAGGAETKPAEAKTVEKKAADSTSTTKADKRPAGKKPATSTSSS